jgi:hypothetical protein
MMTANGVSRPTKDALELLRALSAFAGERKMWMRRGVRGWAFTDELPQSVILVDQLRRYAQTGLILRENASDPFRAAPMCLHRITQVGQNVVADAAGMEFVSISPAGPFTSQDEETVYMSPEAWVILEFLAGQEAGCWFSPADIRKDTASAVYTEDQNLLVSRSLVLREKLDPEQPRVFHATDLGRAARALDVTTSKYRVQIHVPGITEAAQTQRGREELAGRPGPMSGG